MNAQSNRLNPSTMTDVDLVNYRGETMGLTIVDGDDSDLDNMLHAGWTITGIVTIL